MNIVTAFDDFFQQSPKKTSVVGRFVGKNEEIRVNF